MPDEAEYQPQNSIFASNILPDQLSAMTLSGGRTVPHTYYLGPNNTIPFVRLESPVSNKIVSWGETITLQPGANVNIRNVSYMPGDLEIQGGHNACPPPPRVTIPVKGIVEMAPGSNTLRLTFEFPCDTRKARRAWLVYRTIDPMQDAYTSTPITESTHNVTVTGYMRQHSQPSPPIPSNTFTYQDSYMLSEQASVIPLGVSLEGNAMRLVDQAVVQIDQVWGSGYFQDAKPLLDTCCYVLEY